MESVGGVAEGPAVTIAEQETFADQGSAVEAVLDKFKKSAAGEPGSSWKI